MMIAGIALQQATVAHNELTRKEYVMGRKKGKKNKVKTKTVCVVDEPKNEVKGDITLSIEEQPYIEMMQYAHEFSPNECSGVGLVEKVDFNDGSVIFNVTKVFLPLQHNTGASTDIEDDELNKLNTDLVNDGEDTSLLKFHWHSHVDMSVFHSGTDDENYDEMQTGDYAVSLVVNKNYDMLGSVHLYNPLRIDVLNIAVEPPPSIDLDEYVIPKDLRKKIEEAVARVAEHEAKRPATVYSNWPVRHNNNNNGGICPKCQLSYFYCDCNDFYSSHGQSASSGLSFDYDFLQLLRAGEEEGIITLFYDNDNYTVVGYMNNRTQDCYEIESMLDYVSFNGSKKTNSSIGKVITP